MYQSTQVRMRLFAALFISLIGLVFFIAPYAEARTIPNVLTDRVCPRLESAFARLPVSVSLPSFCTPTPPPAPTVDVTVDPASIVNGGTADLSWTSTNADSCAASNGWTGAKATSGDVSVNPTVTTTYTLTCENDGVTASDSATLTVTPAPTAATLTLVKTVTNDDGGTATAANFQAKIDGNDVAWSVAQTVAAGAHTVSETGAAGYTAGNWGGDCATNGTITLAAGESKTCTITNDDQPGTLIVKKVIVNDNNGTSEADDFSFQVNGGTAVAFEADGQNDLSLDAGTYSVTESAVVGYTTTYSNCTNVAVENGETETCTITNNDIAPAPTTATLTLVKVIVNNNNGSAEADDWTLSADGPTDISGVTGAAAVTNAVVNPGEYALSESGGPSGYAASQYGCVKNAGAPVAGNAITLAAGDTATCTITNDDQPGTLVVKKVVVNTGGGTAEADDFSFTVNDEDPLGFEADGQNDVPVDAGIYLIEEVAAANYTASYDNCTDVVVSNGETETCTITNTYVPPAPAGLLLISEVQYDLGTGQGVEPGNEWIEIHNGTNAPVDLTGYMVESGGSSDVLPGSIILPAGGFLMITGSSTTASFWTIPAEAQVAVLANSTIGNGLSNTNDAVTLRNAGNAVVDAVGWGTNTTAFGTESGLSVVAGSSLARTSLLADTNAAADWAEDTTPTPGA